MIDGRYPLSDHHAFFIWLSRLQKFQNLDGYSLVEIYEKNVLEENMSIDRFLEWCRDFDIPTPNAIHGELTEYGEKFNEWFQDETIRVENVYKTWTFENGIDSSEGSVMQFIDGNAQPHYVVTDFENRGTIVG